MRGAVLGAIGAVGGKPLCRTAQATLDIPCGAFDAITQDVQLGAVFVSGNGVGHGSGFLRLRSDGVYATLPKPSVR